MWVTEVIFEILAHKAKIKAVLMGYTVAVVTCYIKIMIIKCSAILRNLVDRAVLLSTDMGWYDFLLLI